MSKKPLNENQVKSLRKLVEENELFFYFCLDNSLKMSYFINICLKIDFILESKTII